jgi:hypothetical protein
MQPYHSNAGAEPMPPRAPTSSDDRNEAAAYIATLSGEMASIARRHGLNTLGYLLDMAKLEAETAARLKSGNGGQPKAG